MTAPGRILKLEFETADEFQQEYNANLANGGVFIPTTQTFELREGVNIELSLISEGTIATLSSEVVHMIPPEMATAGGTPGVAVQFQGAAHEIRATLEPLTPGHGHPSIPPVRLGTSCFHPGGCAGSGNTRWRRCEGRRAHPQFESVRCVGEHPWGRNSRR